MSIIKIRHFSAEDIPQVMAVQQAYQQVYPNASVIPGEVYRSAGFEDGRNIFCAFDENEVLQGYAPLFPNLTFQYQPTETASIEFVLSKGFAYTGSVFRMLRDLSTEIPLVPAPEQIDIQPWRMESVPEQQAYVDARNEAFPEAPIRLADWQDFLSSPAWQSATTITAFVGQEIAGSLTVYWDEGLNQQAGRPAGYTEYIFVRSKWRKRGIAPYMIRQGLIYLKEHGREAAFLEVKANNRRALDLYLGLGYQVIDESHLYMLEL